MQMKVKETELRLIPSRGGAQSISERRGREKDRSYPRRCGGIGKWLAFRFRSTETTRGRWRKTWPYSSLLEEAHVCMVGVMLLDLARRVGMDEVKGGAELGARHLLWPQPTLAGHDVRGSGLGEAFGATRIHCRRESRAGSGQR
jgi:hypothetical protein